jgi:hypothetical protein
MRYNRKTVSVITAPTQPVVGLAVMKSFLGVEHDSDDALIAMFIEAATDAVRQALGRSILTETLELRMDGLPAQVDDWEASLGAGFHTVHERQGAGRAIDLPFGPVASITSITTYAPDNSGTVFSSANYTVDGSRVYLNQGASWPTSLRPVDAVAIRYVSGSALASVPQAIIQAVRTHTAAMYECREGCEMPAACMALLRPYRRLDQLGW